mmetsp:Transcript_28857/g.95978  ORF Transcript_28857/g.95978 Transcript_28857/m.95978 type:complete len:2230 (-) Transcript_28857:59-6748(-)
MGGSEGMELPVEAPDCLFILDAEGRVVEWTSMMVKISSWRREDARGKVLVDTFVTPGQRTTVGSAIAGVLMGGSSRTCEVYLFTKCGGKHWLALDFTARTSAPGVLCHGRDVTTRHPSPRILPLSGIGEASKDWDSSLNAHGPSWGRQVSEPTWAKLQPDEVQNLEDLAPGMVVFILDRDGKVQHWNRKAEEVSGRQARELFGRPLIYTVEAKSTGLVEDALARVLEGQEVEGLQVSFLTESRGLRTLLFTLAGRRNAHGSVRIVGVGQDLTALLAEKERASRELAAVLDAAGVPTCASGLDGRVVAWSWATERLLGVNEHDALGQPWVVGFFSEDSRDDVQRAHTSVLEGGDMVELEAQMLTKDGSTCIAGLIISSSRSALGDITGAMCVLRTLAPSFTPSPSYASRDGADQKDVNPTSAFSRDIKSFGTPVFLLDGDGFVNEWSEKLAELSGWSSSEACGKPLLETFVPQHEHMEVSHRFAVALGHNELSSHEEGAAPGVTTLGGAFALPLLARDGRRLTLWASASQQPAMHGGSAGDQSDFALLVVGQDITQMLEDHAEVDHIADDLSRMIDSSPAPIFGVDAEARVTIWNQAVAQISGFSCAQVIGQQLVQNFISDEYQSDVACAILQALNGEIVPNVELVLVSQSGERHEIRFAAVPRRGPQGTIEGVVAVGHDITDLKLLASEQAREAEDMAHLIKSANAPIIGVDVGCHIMEWNGKMTSMTGYTKDEVFGRPLIDDFIVEESKDVVSQMIQHVQLGVGEDHEFDFELVTKSGTVIMLTMSGSAFRDTTGQIAGIVAVGQDLTKMRDTMLEKSFVAEDLTRLINTANAPILGIDVGGNVTEWNGKAAEISGWSKEEALGKPLLETFIHESYWDDVGGILQKALLGHESANYEFPLFTKDGCRREILLNATTRRGAGGEVTGVIGVGQDITEMRTAMQEQQRIADRLSRFIETANAPIFAVDTQGCVTEWNMKAVTLSGFSKEESLGSHLVAKFTTPEYRQKVEQVLELACQGTETANFEFPLLSKDGAQVQILLNASPTTTLDGQVIGVLCVGQDISGLRALMKQSQSVADDLTRIMDTANAPIIGVNAAGRVTIWNRLVASISGYTADEAVGLPFLKTFIPEEAHKQAHEVLERSLGGEVINRFDLVLLAKGGEHRQLLFNATPRLDTDDTVIGIILVGQDITELKRQTSEALRVASELQRIIDTASAPIVGIDEQGKVTDWNQRFIEVTGVSKDEALGRPFLGYVDERNRQETQAMLEETMKGDYPPTMEMLISTASHEPRVFLLSATPRVDKDGAIVGVICIGQDITSLRELELKKSQFAATVTHELRSPLHGIIGLSDNILLNDQLKQVHHSAQLMNNCARRLLDLVTNIMDSNTLVNSQRSLLSRDPVHITRLIEEVIMHAERAVDKAGRPLRKREVELVNDMDPDKNLPIIEGDAHRCMQMLYNVVTNALKFTATGRVVVSACTDDAEELLTIGVSDTGIGIAPQNQELIFRPFSQEDQSERRRYEGLGLGLSISREIAVKHGGSLTVESEVGKGAKFQIVLPYRPQGDFIGESGKAGTTAGPGAKDGCDMASSPGRADVWGSNASRGTSNGIPTLLENCLEGRIISVDNNSLTQRALARMIKSLPSMQVVLCSSFQECSDQLTSSEEMVPDVILLDFTSHTAGLEALQRFREPESSTSTVPIIALTSQQVSCETIVSLTRQGIDDWIRLPGNIGDLCQRLYLHLAKRRGTKALQELTNGYNCSYGADPGDSVGPPLLRSSKRTPHAFTGLPARTTAPAEPKSSIQAQVGGTCVRVDPPEAATAAPPPEATAPPPASIVGTSAVTARDAALAPPKALEKSSGVSVLHAMLSGWDEALAALSAEDAHAFLCSLAVALETLSDSHGIQLQLATGGDTCLALALPPPPPPQASVGDADAERDCATRLVRFGITARDRVQELRAFLPAQAAHVTLTLGADRGNLWSGLLSGGAPDGTGTVVGSFGTAASGARRLCQEASRTHPGAFLVSRALLRSLGIPDVQGRYTLQALSGDASLPGHAGSPSGVPMIVCTAAVGMSVVELFKDGQVPVPSGPLPLSSHSLLQPPPTLKSAAGQQFLRTQAPPGTHTLERLQDLYGTNSCDEGEGDRRAILDLKLQNAHLTLHASQLERRVVALEHDCARLVQLKVAAETEAFAAMNREIGANRWRHLSIGAGFAAPSSPASVLSEDPFLRHQHQIWDGR